MKYIGIIIKNIRNFIRNLCSEDSPMEDIKRNFCKYSKIKREFDSQKLHRNFLNVIENPVICGGIFSIFYFSSKTIILIMLQ